MVTERVTPVVHPPSSPVGNWVATTPPDHPFRIGAMAKTRAEAEAKFAEAVVRWEAIDVEDSAIEQPAEAGDTEPQKCRHAIYHSDCDWCNAHDVEAEAGDTDGD